MILISISGERVGMRCETMGDFEELRPIVADFKTLLYGPNGTLSIDVSEVDILNKALFPVKKKLKIEQSFIEWKKTRLQTPAVIRVGVIDSKIIKGTLPIPHSDIEEVTKFFVKAAFMSKQFKEKKWDGYVKLYKRWEKTFPTGLLSDVCEALDKINFKYKIEYIYDKSPERQFDWKIKELFEPSEDQLEAVKVCTRTRGVLKAPTGMGKTSMMARYLTVEHGVPTLFVANKKSLLDDCAKDFLEGIDGLNSEDIIQIKDGWFGNQKITPSTTASDVRPITAPIVVATIQSLSARLKDERTRPYLLDFLRNKCKFLQVDETQAVGTKIWDEVLDECYAPYRIFLSATPRRTDGSTIKIMAASGPILYTSTADEQIKKGRLCDLDIFYDVYDHKVYNEDDGDILYTEVYKSFIVENEDRNSRIIKHTFDMLKEERHVLILVQQIEHGQLLKEMFMNKEMPFDEIEFIWGDTPNKKRISAIERFKNGEIKVMIGSTIFDAGVNVPIISGVILAGAGNSDITLIQRIGRGARNCDYEAILGYMPKFMKDNKNVKKTRVIDIMDTNIKFFAKQAKNRYYNASQEFGADRVHTIGVAKHTSKPRTKGAAKLSKQVDQFSAQLAMLDEFSK